MSVRISVSVGGRRGMRHHRHPHHRGHRRHHYNSGGGGGGTFSKGPGGNLFVGVICVAIAALILFLGVRMMNAEANYVKTIGYVVDYHEKWSDGDYLYSEIVEYEVDGKIYECSAESYSSMPKLIGSSMEVRYDPNHPGKAVAGAESRNVLIYIIGGIFGIVGIVSIFFGIKKTFFGSDDDDKMVMA